MQSGNAKDAIWLIGGYGDVGLKTARVLLDKVDNPLVLAGRNGEVAARAAAGLGPRVRGAALDVASVAALPEQARHVLNFVEALPPQRAAETVARGGLYLDASADPGHLARMAAAIGDGPGLAILNAGLTPGLTNILACQIVNTAPQTRAIDVVLEMGMGRHHGYAATAWTLRGLGTAYRGKRDGHWVQLPPAAETRQVRFGPEAKPVPAIGFAFPDQQAIAETLPVDTVRTFLAVDPAYMTRLMGRVARSGLGRFARRHADRLTRLLAYLPPSGGVGTRLAVEGADAGKQATATIGFTSGDQSEITAIMLALAVVAGLKSPETGARNMDAIVPFDAARAALDTRLPETRWF